MKSSYLKNAAACIAFCSIFTTVTASVFAEPPSGTADWTQWGGPSRDFHVDGKGLSEKWGESGPKQLWSRDLGDGYSAIISDGKRLYTMYRIDDKDKNIHQEAVIAIDPKDGKTVWEYKYDAPFEKDMQMEYGAGPNSTPLLVGDKLYTIGVLVNFHCFDKNTGKVLWSHDLRKEYGASHMGRGYGASPLAYKDTIILPIGEEKSDDAKKDDKKDDAKKDDEKKDVTRKGVMAFRQNDGAVVWHNQDFGPTFASPMIVKFGGEDQLLIFADKVIAGLDPNNGEMKWSHEHPTQYGANISTPVWGDDGCLFISSAYGMGSRGLKLEKKDGKYTVEELWFNPKMKIHFGNAVRVGDYVYGSSGDFGPAFFAAVNVKTGKFGWKKRGIAKATCLSLGDKLLILDEDGNLFLGKAEDKRLEIICKAQICQRNAWTVPTLISKTLYVRDRKKIMAIDLG